MMSFMAYIPALRAKLAASAFFSILLISSCSDPASVGLELAPGNNQIGVFYKEFNLDAQVVLLDSFNTVNSGVLVVGHERDPYFGTTEGTGYSRLYIDVTKTRPLATAILDSMFFLMDVVSVNGANLDKPKRYSVHKLTEPILDTLYYNFDEVDYQAIPFGQADFTFKEVKDTIVKMPVTEAFENELFEKMKRGNEFDNLFNFRRYFPGIALKATAGDDATISAEVGDNTGIAVYFHYPGDTVSTRYDMSTFPSRSFNGIKSNRTGTPTEVVQDYGKSYNTGSLVGMKSTMAMAIRINTAPIDEFLDTLRGVTFNQVSFVIGEIENQPASNTPITGMVMTFVDQNNKPILSSINSSRLYVQGDGQAQFLENSNGDKVPNNTFATSSILTYDSEEKVYKGGLTSHINAIYRGDIIRQDWLLDASIPPKTDLSSTGIDFRRSLRQFKVNKDKVTVRVLYSKTR
jgi:hypothetical protein